LVHLAETRLVCEKLEFSKCRRPNLYKRRKGGPLKRTLSDRMRRWRGRGGGGGRGLLGRGEEGWGAGTDVKSAPTWDCFRSGTYLPVPANRNSGDWVGDELLQRFLS